MNILKLKYEFTDYDEAVNALMRYKKDPPEICEWPLFQIDHIEIESDNELTLWLKLIKQL